MATLHYIIGGPSRWDIMMSIFEDKPLQFTLSDVPHRKGFSLNDDGIVSVVVKTLHDHSTEDPILMDLIPREHLKPTIYHKRDQPSWLIIAEYEHLGAPEAPFDTVLIEYDERTRRGIAVTYSEDEILTNGLINIASYWKEKMDLAITIPRG